MTGPTAAAAESAAELVSALAERYYAALLNYLYQLLQDRRLAEELSQDVFLRACDQRRQLPEAGLQRAWLYRIATDLACNAVKRRRRSAWLRWARLRWLRVVAPAADPPEQPEQPQAVERALAALPLDYRAPLLLRDQHGFSVIEIAQALDLMEDAVSVRLQAARQMLRAAWEQESPHEHA